MKIRKKQIHVTYTARLTATKPGRIQVWLGTPTNTIDQQVTSVSITPKINKKYTDGFGNRIHYTNPTSPAKITMQYVATLTQAYGVFTLRKKYKLKSSDLDRYTKSETYLEQTPELKKIARKITQGTDSTPAKLYALTSWIKRNFVYHYPVLNRGVRNINLSKPSGDCGEAGALFVTLCRSLGIPAINKTGYVMYYDEPGKLYEHAWTSIFASDLGWINIDPRAGNVSKHGARYLYAQKNYFLNFSTGYSIPLKPSIKTGANVSLWKKVGLPHTTTRVQVLQPLFFCAPSLTHITEKFFLR